MSPLCRSIACYILVSFSVSAEYLVPYTSASPAIDGIEEASLFSRANWQKMDQLWDGSWPDTDDFSGRYKLIWNEAGLYLLAEIQDDILYDNNPDPLVGYWSDDCLEIFVDPDASGGDHQYNHSAYAYHVSLDNQVVDLHTNKRAILLSDHVQTAWRRSLSSPHIITWEARIQLVPEQGENIPAAKQAMALQKDHQFGFMLSYCDNDGSEVREHFVGSHPIEPAEGSRNRGWIDASVFGATRLVK
ncbi:sugar-binding protein [Aestuariibacter salexigens]|uniref:sugar-binding protein n=1 Tax=Aestuariibacter salexigens TaxID=226010 RepID=UPI00041C2400|nr:sugar-binding protein [Aestuariibacter salexigens]